MIAVAVQRAVMSIPDTDDPIGLFAAWHEEALQCGLKNPTAMALATVDPAGRPTVRMVLLKGFDVAGFVFYTNSESRKGQALEANPVSALCFYWPPLDRQVRIEGPVARVSDAEADAYFASRPRQARIGAWASRQSHPLADRFELERRLARFAAKFAVGAIPRPPYWNGYRVRPQRIEFWREGAFRLHDRLVFTRDGEDWRRERLFP